MLGLLESGWWWICVGDVIGVNCSNVLCRVLQYMLILSVLWSSHWQSSQNQFLVSCMHYIAFGGSAKEGTNALRIDGDLRVLLVLMGL